MGSVGKATITRYICRLCSGFHPLVIHIYSDQGRRLGLVHKINAYLPVMVTPDDPLPKTICESCIIRIEEHFQEAHQVPAASTNSAAAAQKRIQQTNNRR